MTDFWNWLKTHKLTTLLLIIILSLIIKDQRNFVPFTQKFNSEKSMTIAGRGRSYDLSIYPEAPPTTEVTNRMVVRESYLSLLVNNVVESQKKIIKTTENYGGYMVNSNLQNPNDAPSATIIVRIPSSKLNDALEKFRGLAVKVISENLQGTDVTDQYQDNEARLTTLNKTKAKFEEILDRASQIQDILNIQRELINLQSQIDSVKGQQKYLEQTAKLAKITVYLSTDELALPYTPSESWRPEVIFKQAVRSLVGSLRKMGTLTIWVLVYSIIWLPILLIILLIKRKRKIS